MNKTPITILQEMMIKIGEVPSYECIAQTGPHHQAVFEYRCVARGVSATATARSKKEAKQEAARHVLAALAGRAARDPALPKPLPLPAGAGAGASEGKGAGAGGEGAGDARVYVSLLSELCEEYKLGAVQYDLVGDTGPPHLRQFTVRATLGRHQRHATASTKKHARQLVAERLYTYLRENLAAATKDFVEDEAMSRAIDKAMSRYDEAKEEQPWRPDLGQRIADYHTGEERRRAAGEALAASGAAGLDGDEEGALRGALGALGVTAEWGTLESEGGPLSVLTLTPASPALVFAGRTRRAAAAAALRYVRLALAQRAPHRA